MRALEGEMPLPADLAERIFGFDPLEPEPPHEDLWEQVISHLDGGTEKPGRGRVWYQSHIGEIEGNFRLNNQAIFTTGPPQLSESQTRSLIERAQSDDGEARNEVLLDNLGLVTFVLINFPMKITSPAVDEKDLFIEGVVGLNTAISKFDTELGTKLSTYAVHWIRQVINRAMRNQARTVRLPDHVEEELSRVLGADNHLAQSPEHTESDVATKAGISDQHLRLIRRAQHLFINILPLEIAEYVADDEDESEVGLYYDFRRQVNEMLTSTNKSGKPILTEREQAVLRLRFGLEDGKDRTLKDIGEQLGFSYQYARLVEMSAMEKIGRFYRMEDFYDYLD